MKDEKLIDLNKLPLISQYRVLVFYGKASGLPLNQGFPIADLQGRTIVIKSFRLFPYADDPTVDFFVNDGVVSNTETIPPRARINRVFDEFINGAQIDFLINGIPIAFFPKTPEGGYPADLFVDNIYYHFKEKIQTFSCSVDVDVFTDLEGGINTGQPFIKVLIECYIL